MPEPDLMAEAARLAATGPISAAGRWVFRGIEAAVAGLPPAARQAAIWAALGRLAEEDPAVALHAMATMLRVATDAEIQARAPFDGLTAAGPGRRVTNFWRGRAGREPPSTKQTGSI